MEKANFEPLLQTTDKNSRWIKDLKVKPETLKLLQKL